MKKMILIFCCLFMSVFLFASGKKDVLEAEAIENTDKETKSDAGQYEYDKNGKCIKTEFFDDAGKLVHEIIDNSYYTYEDFESWTYEDYNRLYNTNSPAWIPIPRIRGLSRANNTHDVGDSEHDALIDLAKYINRKINEEGVDKNEAFIRKSMNHLGVDKIEIFYENEKFVHLICFYSSPIYKESLENGKTNVQVYFSEVRSEVFLEKGKIVHEKYYYHDEPIIEKFHDDSENTD